MNLRISITGAIGFAAALTLGAATSGVAQDTTRTARDSSAMRNTMRDSTTRRHRVRSTRHIPLRKETGMRSDTTRQQSGGEVVVGVTQEALTTQLNDAMTAERSRVDSMFAADRSRLDDLNTKVNGMNDQIAGVRRDVDALRTSQMALSDSLMRLRTAFNRMRNRSLFNNSGFFVGLAAGANFTNGTLHNIGYDQGLNVEVPIGYRKPGNLLGFQLNLGVQTFDGLNNRFVTTTTGTRFAANNPDPRLYSAIAALTLNFPFSQNKKNEFYLIGGGGVYHFSHYGTSSTLAAQLGDDVFDNSSTITATGTSSVTKWGVTGGAGLQFGMVGPTSIFVESRFTNVFANRANDSSIQLDDPGKNLRWVPLVVGISLH